MSPVCISSCRWQKRWSVLSQTYYTSLGGQESNAISRLSNFLRDALRNAFGNQTLQQVVSENRTSLMSDIRQAVNAQATSLGIEVLDVRIKQVELPENVQDSVYQRMAKERAAIAREIRSQGEESAQAYRSAFSGGNDVMLLQPDSEFFKYFNSAPGNQAPAAGQ